MLPVVSYNGAMADRSLISLAAVACALALAACGSTKSSSTAAASGPFELASNTRTACAPRGIEFPRPIGWRRVRARNVRHQPRCPRVRLRPEGMREAAARRPHPAADHRGTGSRDVPQGAVHPPARFSALPRPVTRRRPPDPPDWNNEAPAAITARKVCANVGIAIPGWGAAWFQRDRQHWQEQAVSSRKLGRT